MTVQLLPSPNGVGLALRGLKTRTFARKERDIMHDEQYILLNQMRIAERLADAERARLLASATEGVTMRRVVAARVGGVLVRVGQWLQATDEAPQAATTG